MCLAGRLCDGETGGDSSGLGPEFWPAEESGERQGPHRERLPPALGGPPRPPPSSPCIQQALLLAGSSAPKGQVCSMNVNSLLLAFFCSFARWPGAVVLAERLSPPLRTHGGGDRGWS